MSQGFKTRRTASSSVFCKYPQNYDFGGRRVLNLGCGFAKFKCTNVVNLDGEACSKADVIWDLSKKPLPFKDGEFDMIIANHILEHVPNWWECFKECARILKVGGILEIWVPGNGSDSILGYRDHINVINHCSFSGTYLNYRNPGNAWEHATENDLAGRMEVINAIVHMENFWWTRWAPSFLRNWMANHLRNIVYEIGFVLKKHASAPRRMSVAEDPAGVEKSVRVGLGGTV